MGCVGCVGYDYVWLRPCEPTPPLPSLKLQGVFNAESVWADEPPPLPPIPKSRVRSGTAKKDPFRKTTASSSMSEGGALSESLRSALSSAAPFYHGTKVPLPPISTVLTTSGIKTATPSAAEEAINRTLGGGGESAQRSTFEGG